MQLPNYINQFKELIKKAGISGEVALHMFGNGLTTDEFEKAMLTQPTSLTGWYCYELVNLSLSYDSNLCINHQA